MKVSASGVCEQPEKLCSGRSSMWAELRLSVRGRSRGWRNPQPFVQDGKAGFVVTHIEYALSQDAKDTGVCPDGMTKGMSREGFGSAYSAAGPGGQRPAGAPQLRAAQGSDASGHQAAPRPEGGRQKCNVRQVNRKKQRQDGFMQSMMGPNGREPVFEA